MTPKQKAKHLVDSFRVVLMNEDTDCASIAIKNAEICVSEIINQWEYIDIYLADLCGELNPNLTYWYNVQSEIRLM